MPRTEPLRNRQLAFGYTQEDLRVLLAPTAAGAAEPIGSMGNDLALAVLSDRQPALFSYFKQLFAQVTNPPIDPIRESVVMSVASGVGSERNLFDETAEHAHQLSMPTPILRSPELEKLRQVDSAIFEAHTLDITWPTGAGPDGLANAVDRICAEASESIARGVNILILSDRNVGPERVPIPALLAVASVHHHLVRAGTRLQAGLVLESGEPREVHHFATLIGYGASAINPYLMFESLDELVADGRLPDGMTADEAEAARRQGHRQGPAQDDLEDGDLDDPVLHGRADLRGRRPRARADRRSTSRAPPRGSAASASTCSRARRSTATRAPTRARTRTCCRSAASTPGAARASTTCGTRSRSRCSSTPSATAAPRRSRSTRR